MTTLVLLLSLAQELPPAELEKGIDKAIKSGVEWVKKQQKPDGSFGDSSGPTYGPGQAYHNKPGNTALCLLALLKSDVDPADIVVTRGFKFIQEYMKQDGNLRSTYDRGMSLMAFEGLYEAQVNAKLKKEGKPVTERAGDFREPRYTLTFGDASFAGVLVKELAAEQTKAGGWRYGTGFGVVGSEEDVSATQIVLLGLKSATRMKVGVNSAIFQKAMTFVLDSQEKDGPVIDRPSDQEYKPGDRGTYASLGRDRARGWAYELKSDKKDETTVTGSMTCAGIAELLICKSVLGKSLTRAQNERAETAIYDGFAWLYRNWTVANNPQSTRSHLYFLYGLERVGTLGCYEKVGKHKWFQQGAQVLIRAQKSDGSWTDEEVPPKELYASCFALLFLKRGTVPIGDVMTGDRK